MRYGYTLYLCKVQYFKPILAVCVGSDSSSDYNACVSAKNAKEPKGTKKKENFRTAYGNIVLCLHRHLWAKLYCTENCTMLEL